MKTFFRLMLNLALLVGCLSSQAQAQQLGQGMMVGEVTATGAVVQARVTDGIKLVDGDKFDDGDALRDGDLPGAKARLRFFYRQNEFGEEPYTYGEWIEVKEDHDYIARVVLQGLKPGTNYTCFAEIEGVDPDNRDDMTVARADFQTLQGADFAAATRFHVVTGMNYDKFFGSDGNKAYEGADRELGYPAYEAMQKLKPDFIIYTGDDVYYDKNPKVKTLADMRAKWHRQFSRPRFIELSKSVPGYWMKDDHDHRTNDSDATGDYFPSHELGIKTFREQVPIVAQDDDKSPTYRTHRVSKDLQIWLLEGRDYRSPNKMEDGPDKTMWGAKQLKWLKMTLLESDATHKMIISPTPMVGPDDGYKSDNHTNPSGFKHEGDAFKNWAAEQGLWNKSTYFLCGDRHWQYHSIDPSGAHEFSCGAICDANSRLGRKPGDKNSTDPEALIKQPYVQKSAAGGFLSVVVKPSEGVASSTVRFEFYKENGEKLYTYQPDKE